MADIAAIEPEVEAFTDRLHPTDKALFLNALGALLASTMESDMDSDFCESR